MPPIPAVMPGVDHVDAPCVLLSLGGMSGAGARRANPNAPDTLCTGHNCGVLPMLRAGYKHEECRRMRSAMPAL